MIRLWSTIEVWCFQHSWIPRGFLDWVSDRLDNAVLRDIEYEKARQWHPSHRKTELYDMDAWKQDE